MKDHRHNARVHDVRLLGCSPSSEEASIVVSGGHAALDRALARAAARNVAQPPVSALRAACSATYGTTVAVVPQAPAPRGRALDAFCVSPDREHAASRVVHVAAVREVTSSRGARYTIRTWRELSAISAN
ncbi:MAG: hypothetical protein PGN13_00705 [Patulibacter minatonensis]